MSLGAFFMEKCNHVGSFALASAAAVITGYSATTFNAAGLDTAQIKDPAPTPPQVNAYYVHGEPLSATQDNRAVTMPTALAIIDAVPYVGEAAAADVIVQEASGHRVMPQAYGTRSKLPAANPEGSGDYIYNRHFMSWVLSGIEARQKQLGGHAGS